MSIVLKSLETSKLCINSTLINRSHHFLNGLSPGREKWEFAITMGKVTHTSNISKGALNTLADCVQSVIADSNARVFQGIKRDGIEEGLCYLGLPPTRYNAHGDKIGIANQDEFFVFVNHDREIYHWLWETVSASDLENRFLRRVR